MQIDHQAVDSEVLFEQAKSLQAQMTALAEQNIRLYVQLDVIWRQLTEEQRTFLLEKKMHDLVEGRAP